jgi:hypothetical protein
MGRRTGPWRFRRVQRRPADRQLCLWQPQRRRRRDQRLQPHYRSFHRHARQQYGVAGALGLNLREWRQRRQPRYPLFYHRSQWRDGWPVRRSRCRSRAEYIGAFRRGSIEPLCVAAALLPSSRRGRRIVPGYLLASAGGQTGVKVRPNRRRPGDLPDTGTTAAALQPVARPSKCVRGSNPICDICHLDSAAAVLYCSNIT